MATIPPVELMLYSRTMLAINHRLRGLSNLLGGWSLMEAPPEMEPKLEAYIQESALLFDQLDLIRQSFVGIIKQGNNFDQEFCDLLLSATLGLGTTAEAGESLPRCRTPKLSFALAIELENARAQLGKSEDNTTIEIEFTDKEVCFSFNSKQQLSFNSPLENFQQLASQ